MAFAVDVAGKILRRPAELEQHLLQVPAFGRVDRDRVGVDDLAEHPRHLLGPGHFGEHRGVGGDQHQAVHRMLLDPQPPVPVHRLGDIDQQRARHRVARIGQQHVDDLLGVMARGPGVPQAQRGEPIGVDVLGGPLQFRERGDRQPALVGQRVVHLEQERTVRLHDQRSQT
ncbi:hypothetical protein SDC9_124998 [bioreactor metagenome]|uniref:Uncharacterized protein n=1 Tax=bioreactor metagenome TaxID=1076179 RepID=A0A645CM45_9ZZZZ